MVRKNGKIGLIGDYVGYTNHFNIGAFMEKHLSMAGGQLWPHKYYEMIFNLMREGKIHPECVFTHTYPLSQIAEAYSKFDKHEDGIIKILVIPDDLYKKL
jgi:threonine dehydrogenase-like Zn-dependent dehydrogenase